MKKGEKKMKTKIEELIRQYEEEVEIIEEDKGEDFNPMDASGGNFDDAYDMGYEDGFVYGKLDILRELLKEF